MSKSKSGTPRTSDDGSRGPGDAEKSAPPLPKYEEAIDLGKVQSRDNEVEVGE
jgi:hypothetical protein